MLRRLARVARKFVRAEDGPTAVEYAAMLAVVIVVCVTAVTTLGTNTKKPYTTVSNTIGGTGS